MEAHDLDRLRRSIAMLPPDHVTGALTRRDALALVDELARLDRLTARYRDVIAELRSVLGRLDGA